MTRRLEAFVFDIHGVTRGKWILGERIEAVRREGLAMPGSTLGFDLWGGDVPAAGLSAARGDPDIRAVPLAWSDRPAPWAGPEAWQILLAPRERDGTPFFADPRAVVQRQIERLGASGLIPVAAVELEFYLLRATDGAAANAAAGAFARAMDLADIDAHAPVIEAILDACAAQDLPVDTVVRESGPGQFEINLTHRADALRAADEACLLKRAVKAVARRHGFAACFMAKPFGGEPGSGMHVHLSLVDRAGGNAFAATPAVLDRAIAGLLDTMAAFSLVWAPHANSGRRFRPGQLAPSRVAWAEDNRTAALRLIRDGEATRIEHRVSGADASPHLAVAAILAGIEAGLAGAAATPAGASGDVGQSEADLLPSGWQKALRLFAHSPLVEQAFGAAFRDLIAAVKRQEIAIVDNQVPELERQFYADLA